MEKLDIEDLAANITKFTVDKNGNVYRLRLKHTVRTLIWKI